ncbi:hypothetical protein ACFWY9_43795 [Amycolatopsis sp. NPDC059027]|uniref:hypothetical protein n=1 Tax=unclassified Amycolatopsis TaxID=2618356 RepID=UPI003670D82F
MTAEFDPRSSVAVLIARGVVTTLAAGVGLITASLSLLFQHLARCLGDLFVDGCQRQAAWSWSLWWTLLPAAVGVPCAISAIVVAFRTDRAARAWTAGLILLGIGALLPFAMLWFVSGF